MAGTNGKESRLRSLVAKEVAVTIEECSGLPFKMSLVLFDFNLISNAFRQFFRVKLSFIIMGDPSKSFLNFTHTSLTHSLSLSLSL